MFAAWIITGQASLLRNRSGQVQEKLVMLVQAGRDMAGAEHTGQALLRTDSSEAEGRLCD